MKEVLEFIKDVINSGIDRLKFPLFNSFIISWLIFNWKPVFIVLFENWPMHVRVAYVSENYSNALYTVGLPLIFSISYVLLTPFLKTLFFLSLSKVNDFNRKNDYKYYIGFAQERDHLAQLDYQRSVIKAGKQHADQMAQEIETLKAQNEKIENEKRLADKTIQAQIEEIRNLQLVNDQIINERDEALSSIQGYQSRYDKIMERLSKSEKTLTNTESQIVILKNENGRLEEDKSRLYSERELDREKIKKLPDEFGRILDGYQDLIAKVIAKFIELKDYVPQNRSEKFDDTVEYSDDRLRILNSDYKDFLAKNDSIFRTWG